MMTIAGRHIPKLAVVAAVAALIVLPQVFQVIEPGERGVSVILGWIDPQFRGEGLTLKIPFIQQIAIKNIRTQRRQGREDAYSSDLQTVTISYEALYRVPESRVVTLVQQIQGDPFDTLVNNRIQDALKQVCALYRAEDLVKNRDKIKRRVLDMVNLRLREKEGAQTAIEAQTRNAAGEYDMERYLALGNNPRLFNPIPLVYLEDLPIQNIDLTDDLEKAIEQKQIKEQEALAKRYELDKARKQAEIVDVEATAEAQALKKKSDAIRQTPQILELEMKKLDLEMTGKVLQKWDGKSPSTVVVGQGGGNVLLPLR